MAAKFTSNLADWQRRHAKAVPAALTAAALVYVSALKRAHRGKRYYKHGRYSVGRVRNSITHTAPKFSGGVWEAFVGTNVRYALFWTVGHFNLFSKQYERVDLWTPTVMEARSTAMWKFATVYEAIMGARYGEFGDAPTLDVSADITYADLGETT